jgi:uncharacterized protein
MESRPADVRIHWSVRIPLRGGARLGATLYTPQDGTPTAPAIIAMTPYIAQSHHAQAMHFAARGFAFAVVDVRGRADSEGTFHPLNEADDAYDVIEWVAAQPYCNGVVGMWGGSYLGYCQWAAASRHPPHLATIVPVAAPFRGVDSPMRNNVFTPYTMQWLTMVTGRSSQEKIFADQGFWCRKFKQFFESGRPFSELDRFFGNPSPLFQEWISHPQRDAYWDSYNPTSQQYSRIGIPILTITGAYDADQLGAIAHYREHIKNASPAARARHYLVIGPWDHAGTALPKAEFGGIRIGAAGVIDVPDLQRQWYAWTMLGESKPALLKEQVSYYVAVADQWRHTDTLDAVTARSDPLFLQSADNPTDVYRSGSLGSELPTSASPDHYVYDPRDVAHAELESTLDAYSLIDQQMLHAAAGRQLIYHSPPFARDLDVCGFFELRLWLAIDRPDTDLRAMVYEVDMNGEAILLTTDWVRARYREGLRDAKLIERDTPLRYTFENFMFIARTIRRGHRLRLVIGPINSIHWQKNYNGGGVVAHESMADARPVTVKLFHDDAHPSALYVPYGTET